MDESWEGVVQLWTCGRCLQWCPMRSRSADWTGEPIRSKGRNQRDSIRMYFSLYGRRRSSESHHTSVSVADVYKWVDWSMSLLPGVFGGLPFLIHTRHPYIINYCIVFNSVYNIYRHDSTCYFVCVKKCRVELIWTMTMHAAL